MTNIRSLIGLLAVASLVVVVSYVSADTKNGFDLDGASVPSDEILPGVPSRDSIPAIDEPKFIPPEEATYLNADDVVISVSSGGVTRAYPTRILDHHEVVNDVIGEHHFMVTYCPLCGTGMVFNRDIGGTVATFGVSGLLYQSDVLLYDRGTESLWSQMARKAIAGPMKDRELTWEVSDIMTWEAWRKRFPTGEVLSTDTGYRRPYDQPSYASYRSSKELMFPVNRYRETKGVEPKAWVLGVLVDGIPVAYKIGEQPDEQELTQTIGGRDIVVRYDPQSRHAEVIDKQGGEKIPSVMAYWFAWQAFYPQTRLITGGQ